MWWKSSLVFRVCMGLIGSSWLESDPVITCQISRLRTPRAICAEPSRDLNLHPVQACSLRAAQPMTSLRTYRARIHTAFPLLFAVRFVHATLVRATPRWRRSPHRSGPVQASPALYPCEPRRPPGVKQAVIYCARSGTTVVVFELVRTSISTDPLCPQI